MVKPEKKKSDKGTDAERRAKVNKRKEDEDKLKAIRRTMAENNRRARDAAAKEDRSPGGKMKAARDRLKKRKEEDE